MGFWQVTASPRFAACETRSRCVSDRETISTKSRFSRSIMASGETYARPLTACALSNRVSHAATIWTLGIRRHASAWCREKNPQPIMAPLNTLTVQCPSFIVRVPLCPPGTEPRPL